MDISSIDYKRAFEAYLRHGTPIDLSRKQARPSKHYIWRTRKDRKVRPTHAANDGIVFTWDYPPPTGHPGEDYGCRCTAEPYYGKAQESVSHNLTALYDTGPRWENHDLVWHFYTGDSKSVTLSEIGHLKEIADHWAYKLKILRENWSPQIFKKARDKINGYITEKFEQSYDFTGVEFSHGGSVVKGYFSGTVSEMNGLLTISGETEYRFSDRFTDPVDVGGLLALIRKSPNRIRILFQKLGNLTGIREGDIDSKIDVDKDDVYEAFMTLTEIGGNAYNIDGSWTSNLKATIFHDNERSGFKNQV